MMFSILVAVLGAAAVTIALVAARRARDRRLRAQYRKAVSFNADEYLRRLDQARTQEDIDRLEDESKGDRLCLFFLSCCGW